ncbi:hypothetical protein [Shewanella cutis]|uniref:RING-type E3 ubiquitin transferase n=1 Tax=Shewanella cutis TaxID=2766780 RepID=A0ABS9R1E6_9GAMM|nr:hypothetical protein [Shewanella sp. PS-2]MCG9966426.1 hypothetical protein [Shewanella sp. PS-2]
MNNHLTALTLYLQGMDSNSLTFISIVVSVIGVLLSLLVAILGVWFAIAQYRLKRSTKIIGSVCFSRNCDFNDIYPNKIVLQNLKDKSEAIFGIHIKLSNNIYISMENLEDSPIVIAPFETLVRNYKPVSFYGSNSYKVDINRLIQEKMGCVVVLTTNKGKYLTKQKKHYWSPIVESLKNNAISALNPYRITENFPNGFEYTVPSNAKFVVRYSQNNEPKAAFIYREKLSYSHTSDIFELTAKSLIDKQSLHEHITKLDSLHTTHKVDIPSIEIIPISELPEQKRLDDFFNKSRKETSRSWLFVHVLGKAITVYRAYKMKQSNHDRYNKNFTYNESLVTKWLFIIAFSVLIILVMREHIIDLFEL